VNNPAKYDDEYHFRIKFEAISALAEGTFANASSKMKLMMIDLEWKLVYVGSANSEDFDQELDSCMGQSLLPLLSLTNKQSDQYQSESTHSTS
jgi:histone chaperone ASF1